MSKVAKRKQRRGWAIHGYVGPNGSGKSATAVYDSIPSLLSGRPVLSTVRLLDFENPRACEGWRFDLDKGETVECEICVQQLQPVPDFDPEPTVLPDGTVVPAMVHPLSALAHRQAHPLWRPFREWSQLLEARHCDVIMDEVTGIASSRESHGMPAAVANTLVQMRRADVVIRWTAPAWARADKIIRECSQAVTYCVGYLPKAHSDETRMWRNRRLCRARTYDAQLFEDFTSGKREQLGSMVQSWTWLPRSEVFDVYDSFDAVLTIGTVSEGGSCERCGGRRARKACKCPDNHAEAAEETPAGPPRSGVLEAPRGRRVRVPELQGA